MRCARAGLRPAVETRFEGGRAARPLDSRSRSTVGRRRHCREFRAPSPRGRSHDSLQRMRLRRPPERCRPDPTVRTSSPTTSIRRASAHSLTAAEAEGATTRTSASHSIRPRIFCSPTLPAPRTRQLRPSNFRNIGNRGAVFIPVSPPPRAAPERQVGPVPRDRPARRPEIAGVRRH